MDAFLGPLIALLILGAIAAWTTILPTIGLLWVFGAL